MVTVSVYSAAAVTSSQQNPITIPRLRNGLNCNAAVFTPSGNSQSVQPFNVQMSNQCTSGPMFIAVPVQCTFDGNAHSPPRTRSNGDDLFHRGQTMPLGICWSDDAAIWSDSYYLTFYLREHRPFRCIGTKRLEQTVGGITFNVRRDVAEYLIGSKLIAEQVMPCYSELQLFWESLVAN